MPAQRHAGLARVLAPVAAVAALALASCGGRAPVDTSPALRVGGLAVRLAPESGRVLVARAGLTDGNFVRTVVLLVDAGDEATWGLIVNRPTGDPLASAFPDVELFRSAPGVLHFGGPVGPRRVLALVRAASAPEDSRRILRGVHLVWSMSALAAAVSGGASFRMTAGFAGWAPGQLDGEIQRGDWLVAEADDGMLFDHDGVEMWEVLSRRADTLVVEARAP